MYAHGRQRGFTLIEQMLTLAVALVLTGLAIPAMGNLLRRSDVALVSDTLVHAMHVARQDAVLDNVDSLLCPSRDGRHCSHDPDWLDGWLIGHDRDHDNQPDAAPLAVGAATVAGVTVIGSRARVHVRFHPNGGAGGSNLTLLICRTGSTQGARRVILSNSGRVRAGDATPKQASACKDH